MATKFRIVFDTDADETLAIDAFAAQYNYPDQVDDGNGTLIANPETKIAHFERKIWEYIAGVADSQLAKEDKETALSGVTYRKVKKATV